MSSGATQRAPGMRRRVLGGLAWTGGSQIVVQVLSMVVAVVLARILAPDDYGLAALAVVFSSLVLVFSDLALGAAIIQRKTLTEDDRSTAFWMSVGTGAVFTVAGVALSSVIADFYGEPTVGPLCAALSLSFLVTSLATTHEALLLRDMKFDRLERRVMIATLAGAVAGVTVAVVRADAWAIIAQQLTHAVVSTILLWASSTWRPRLRFSAASLRSLGSFSAYLVGHRLLYYAHRNADNIIIGRFLGATALGAYTLAYNLMLVPFSKLGGPAMKVLGPAFSRMQDEPQRIGAAWVRVVRLIGLVSVPALFGLIVVAPDFIRVVLGDAWAPAVPIVQILAWVGVIQSLQTVSTDILQARGRTRTIFRFSIFFCSAHVLAFAIGVNWGVTGVAAGYAISSTLVEPVYLWLTARSIGFSPLAVLRGVRGVFEAALVMVGAVVIVRSALVEAHAPSAVRLLAAIAVGVVVFGAMSAWRTPEAWRDLWDLLPGGVKSRLEGLRRRRRGAGVRPVPVLSASSAASGAAHPGRSDRSVPEDPA